MSHSWTGFGLVMLAAICHSTVLVSKVERLQLRRISQVKSDLLCTLAECVFVWTALVSGLRVVVSPLRELVPECNIVESAVSSCALVVWAILLLYKATKLEKDHADRTGSESSQNDKLSAGLRIGLMLAVSFSVGMLMASSLPWTSRLGLVCFLRVVSTHVILLAISGLIMFRMIRVGLRQRRLHRERTMERLRDEDDALSWPRTPSFFFSVATVLSFASVALIVAFGVARKQLEGNIGFWECWVLVLGLFHLRNEWTMTELHVET